ncbi:MAG: discoidin domain-containing protein [Clostridia bacterium]|nr:discoidin domain-containing protein [Clostridia bacterium]
MERYLSKESISTFRGNILPLQLLGEETEYTTEKITWKCSDEKIVQLTKYDKNYRYGGEFTNGVLLTFLEVGEATVTAKFGRKEYTCKIEVHEMRHVEPSKDLRYFVGDMHDHTYTKHTLAEFESRDECYYPVNNYMRQMKECGKMDFGVVSDHGNMVNARDFFRGYADAEKVGDSVIYFQGGEGQVTMLDRNRFGLGRFHGGEVLMLNTDTTFTVDSWEAFFKGISHSPFAFLGFPHPQVESAKGRKTPDGEVIVVRREHTAPAEKRFTDLFRFVEMGDGSNRMNNMQHEYAYAFALDNGYRVSPTSASDSHGSKGGWGYDVFPGKTVIMAPEKSKEAFLDAIMHNRLYSTATGNVKLYYEVNGKTAPATLNNEGEYHFHIELSYFRMGEPDTHIKRCRLITDGGRELLEIQNTGDVIDFTVSAPDSHWFHLTLIDELGRKTFSCPVWTGLPFENKKEKKLTPIDKEGVKVFDKVSGKDASVIMNGDPLQPYDSEHSTADFLINLGKETEVSALSNYNKWHLFTRETRNMIPDNASHFPSKYRIWVSLDGENFERVALGRILESGGEYFIRFPKKKARYVRLEILETIGRAWEREEFYNATLSIGEITLWN